MIEVSQVSLYCREDPSLIENYGQAIADDTQTWDCHHRLEIQGDLRLSMSDLQEKGLYYKRPACELVFMIHSEHMKMHMMGNKNTLGFCPSVETRAKMSAKRMGNKYNLGKKRSAEERKKISDRVKGENHPLYGKHHSEETKRKISEAHKGRSAKNKGTHWYNDGVIQVQAFECPEGFRKGQIKKRG